jgi:hypothetical protein
MTTKNARSIALAHHFAGRFRSCSIPLLLALLPALAATALAGCRGDAEDVAEVTAAVTTGAGGAADSDGDGYPDSEDCAPTDATIHPNTKERGNGIDDNCDGVADEPMLSYSTARPPETQTYAQLATFTLRITDSSTIDYFNTHATAGFTLTYQPLSAASGPEILTSTQTITIDPTTWKLPVFLPILGLPILGPPILSNPPWVPPPPLNPTTRILSLDPNAADRNLLPMTVYRVKVQLSGDMGGALGPSSSWFYVVTGGTSTAPSTTLKQGRIDMVAQALNQLGDFRDGLIGQGGTLAPDGTRFTGSSMTPLHPSYQPVDDLGWCDWFYHYIGAVVTDGLDGNIAANPVLDGGNRFWNTMNPDNIPNAFRDPLYDGCGTEIGDADKNGTANEIIFNGCQKLTSAQVTLDTNDNQFYSNIPTNVYYDAIKSLPSNQGIGNYQAMDSHAGMFLAFDPNGDGTSTGTGTIGTVWSIEGNVSNRAQIMHRASDNTVINGFGKLTTAMFSP